MTHRHKLTGRKLRKLEERDGKGIFDDGGSIVICQMAYVTEGLEPLPELPVYPPEYYRAMIKTCARENLR